MINHVYGELVRINGQPQVFHYLWECDGEVTFSSDIPDVGRLTPQDPRLPFYNSRTYRLSDVEIEYVGRRKGSGVVIKNRHPASEHEIPYPRETFLATVESRLYAIQNGLPHNEKLEEAARLRALLDSKSGEFPHDVRYYSGLLKGIMELTQPLQT